MMITNNSIVNDPKIKNNFFNFQSKFKFENIFNIKLLEKEIINSLTYKTKYSNMFKSINGFTCQRKDFSIINKYKINDSKYDFLIKNKLNFTDPKYLIKFLYLEIFILIESFEKEIIDLKKFKEEIRDYFNIRVNDYKTDKNKNRDILLTNTSSYLLPNDKNKLDNKYEDLRNEIGFNLIEINKNFKRKELLNFLLEVKEIKKKLEIRKLNLNLRFKKIKIYKKLGMYIVKANTIILDPREPSSFIHELGHYIYENNIPFTLDNKRIYKQEFQKIIKDNKIKYLHLLDNKSKIEDYEVDSEIFAYWFESNFS